MKMDTPLGDLAILDMGQCLDQIRIVEVGRLRKWLQCTSDIHPCLFFTRKGDFQGRADLHFPDLDTELIKTVEHSRRLFISKRHMARIEADPYVFKQMAASLVPGDSESV